LKNLEKVQKNLNSSSSLTDAKKSTYNELIDYFMESVTIKINKINEEQISDENLDGIINQIF
jgi:regulator of sigma D